MWFVEVKYALPVLQISKPKRKVVAYTMQRMFLPSRCGDIKRQVGRSKLKTKVILHPMEKDASPESLR